MATRERVGQARRVRVLVTGAKGFVGRRVCRRLSAGGHEAVPLDLPVDIADAPAVRDAVAASRPEAVLHLAAQSSVAASLEQPDLAYRTNYLGAHAVLEAVRLAAPGARVLLVSSSQIYGTAEPGAKPFDEASPLRPRAPYDRTKAAADLLGAAYAESGLDVLRPRPFNHTGPGQSDAFVASSFARQIAEMELGRHEPCLRVGNLDSMRDFLDVEDVVDAYLALLDPAIPRGAYNVASGEAWRARRLLDVLLAATHVRPRIEVDPARVRPTDVSVGDAARLARATGWRPRRRFDETLHALLDDWRRRVSAA